MKESGDLFGEFFLWFFVSAIIIVALICFGGGDVLDGILTAFPISSVIGGVHVCNSLDRETKRLIESAEKFELEARRAAQQNKAEKALEVKRPFPTGSVHSESSDLTRYSEIPRQSSFGISYDEYTGDDSLGGYYSSYSEDDSLGGYFPGCPEEHLLNDFDTMFDIDGDGKLDFFEQEMKYDVFFGDDE